MAKKIHGIITIAALALIPFTEVQGEGRFELPDGVVVTPQAYGHLEAGQIVHGNLKYNDITKNDNKYGIAHIWTEDAVVNLGFKALYKEHLKIVCMLETKLYFSYPQFLTDDRFTKNLRQDVALEDVYAQFYLGEESRPDFYGQVGYFKFKYNPDVRNLGEYLFRTGTYPAFIDNGFDFPMRRLLGFHAQGNILDRSLKGDLFFVSATVYPAMNWSLAGLASYDVLGLHAVEIGGGMSFSHLFDVYNKYSFIPEGGNPTKLNPDKNGKFIKDTIHNASGGIDTIYDCYTFKGTKVMGRLNFNPQAIMPMEFLGKEDLKFYIEACVIGWKNYPDSGYSQGGAEYTLLAPSYDNRWERTPIAFGINLPTHPVFTYGIIPGLAIWWLEKQFDLNLRLDILNLEFELYRVKYNNDASGFINLGSLPLPSNVNVGDSLAPKRGQLYWSVYAKKSFFDNHFSVILQCARDHMRLPCAAYNKEYWNDLLVADEDWWWAFKTSWSF